jgi:hypothetical protein
VAAQAELILFAIRSAVRINQQVRRGFADIVRTAEIQLPLPDFPSQPNIATARTFFSLGLGKPQMVVDARVRALFDKHPNLAAEEEREFLALYQEHWAFVMSSSAVPGQPLNADLSWDDCRALLLVRQWRRGAEQTPSVLQRAAGTLVEIAIDYHLQVPGVVNTNTTQGKIVKGFLESIEQIEFAEAAPRAVASRLVESLFVSTLEALSNNPELVASGDRAQELVATLAKEMVVRAQKSIAGAPDQLAREHIEAWAKAVFPSLVTAASVVFAQPKRFLGVDRQAEGALVSAVGSALLGAISDGTQVRLADLFSRETLDAVTASSLQVVARYPKLIGAQDKFIGQLLSAMVTDLGKNAVQFGPGLLPELIRLVMEKSASHLELLLPEAAAGDPRKHLLLAALRTLLETLSRPVPAGAKWKLAFSADDALGLAEAVLVEVVQNPRWVVSAANKAEPLLGEVVSQTVDAVRAKGGPILRRETAMLVVSSAVAAVGRRFELAVKNDKGEIPIAAVVAMVVDAAFGPGAPASSQWVLARDEIFRSVIAIVLDRVAASGKTAEAIAKIEKVLQATVDALAKAEVWSLVLFGKSLDEALGLAQGES